MAEPPVPPDDPPAADVGGDHDDDDAAIAELRDRAAALARRTADEPSPYHGPGEDHAMTSTERLDRLRD